MYDHYCSISLKILFNFEFFAEGDFFIPKFLIFTKKTLVFYVKYFWSNVMDCCLALDLLKFSRIGIMIDQKFNKI